MKDLEKLNTAVLTLPTDASAERLIELRGGLDFAKQFVKEIERALEERMVSYIEEHGPVPCGDLLHVVSEEKSYKPKMDAAGMTQAFLNLHGGDLNKFVGYLSASAFKHGQLRKDLEEMKMPEVFDQFFETVVKKTVEGKPLKRVKKVDTKFI